MRVIWISIVLFAVLVIGGIGIYEPDMTKSIAAAKKAIVENPFADESVADNEVDLPALPQQTLAASGESGAADQTTPEDPVAAATQNEISSGVSVPEPGQVANFESSQETSVALVEDADSISTNDTQGNASADQVTTSPAEQESDRPKKLGLAMLELEKENKRNKIAVIVHADNPNEITPEQIKAMYLDRVTQWQDGSKVMLYNLPLGDKYREKFSQNILNMTALEADSQEIRRRELNINVNPVEVKAKNIVVSYVEQHPNAVAYVPLVMVRDRSNVKVVMTIP